jgi:hypothetical protein
MKISRESWIIAAIGIADLATTLIWVQHHKAMEANPLFARYLAMGVGWFAAMKILLLAAPIVILEWARARRPVFTRWAARFAIVAYVALYGVGVAQLNMDRPELTPYRVVMITSGLPPGASAPGLRPIFAPARTSVD